MNDTNEQQPTVFFDLTRTSTTGPWIAVIFHVLPCWQLARVVRDDPQEALEVAKRVALERLRALRPHPGADDDYAARAARWRSEVGPTGLGTPTESQALIGATERWYVRRQIDRMMEEIRVMQRAAGACFTSTTIETCRCFWCKRMLWRAGEPERSCTCVGYGRRRFRLKARVMQVVTRFRRGGLAASA